MIPAGVGMALLARPIVTRAARPRRLPGVVGRSRPPTTLRAFAIGLVFFSVYLYVMRTLLVDAGHAHAVPAERRRERRQRRHRVRVLRVARGRGPRAGRGRSRTRSRPSSRSLALRRRLGRLDGRALARDAVRVVVARGPGRASRRASLDRAIGDAPAAASSRAAIDRLLVGGRLSPGCSFCTCELQLLRNPPDPDDPGHSAPRRTRPVVPRGV